MPIGIATIKLIVENQDIAIVTARELIDRSQQEINVEPKRQQLLQLIETILVYKFPTMSRKEIEEMFGLSDLKQTRVYQEAKQEGLQEGIQEGIQEGKQEGIQEGGLKAKLAAVSRLLALGLTVEQIAQALDLNVEQVRQAAQGD